VVAGAGGAHTDHLLPIPSFYSTVKKYGVSLKEGLTKNLFLPRYKKEAK
jgi:hypothetical protein